MTIEKFEDLEIWQEARRPRTLIVSIDIMTPFPADRYAFLRNSCNSF
jgi:hypothetical protein